MENYGVGRKGRKQQEAPAWCGFGRRKQKKNNKKREKVGKASPRAGRSPPAPGAPPPAPGALTWLLVVLGILHGLGVGDALEPAVLPPDQERCWGDRAGRGGRSSPRRDAATPSPGGSGSPALPLPPQRRSVPPNPLTGTRGFTSPPQASLLSPGALHHPPPRTITALKGFALSPKIPPRRCHQGHLQRGRDRHGDAHRRGPSTSPGLPVRPSGAAG